MGLAFWGLKVCPPISQSDIVHNDRIAQNRSLPLDCFPFLLVHPHLYLSHLPMPCISSAVSIYLSIYLLVYLSICLSAYLSIYLHIHIPIQPIHIHNIAIYLSVCPSVSDSPSRVPVSFVLCLASSTSVSCPVSHYLRRV